MRLLLPVCLSAAVGFGASCAPTIPDDLDWVALSAPASYRLGGGDRVRIEVMGREDMTREVVVRPDGALTFPLVGDVRAAERRPEEVARDLRARLERYVKNPTVNVTVLEVRSYAVYVVGEVTKPGQYRSREPLTVLQVLALGGGFTSFADRDATVIIRRGDAGKPDLRIPFVFGQVIDGERPEMNIFLRSGDTVVVP